MNAQENQFPTGISFPFSTVLALAMICFWASAQTSAPKIKDVAMVPRLTIEGVAGMTNTIEYADELATNQWQVLTNLVVANNPYVFVDLTAPPSPKRFYRVVVPGVTDAPAGMVLIPDGSFVMGDTFGEGLAEEIPTHTVQVSRFYMDKYEVTKALWQDVYQWATNRGYNFNSAGSGKANNHPAHTMAWHDAVKWCNARSEKEGRVPAYYTNVAHTAVYRKGVLDVQNSWVKWDSGYRLPTEAEWEKAARGGGTGKRFYWGDFISHSDANYFSYWENGRPFTAYDRSTTQGYHPDYRYDQYPYTGPVGSFPPNWYGLYDMAGNVMEFCWDWYGSYPSSTQVDPRGPTSGLYKMIRGGSWDDYASNCRLAFRSHGWPDTNLYMLGFRCVMSSGQ